MNDNFYDLVGETLVIALRKQGIEKPSAVQIGAIKEILEGKDVAAESQTGSGKTLAYLLPLFIKTDGSINKPQSLVLAPTQELASQVYRQARFISQNAGGGIHPALLIGGASIEKQIDALKEKPQILMGTCGRVLELIRLKKLSGHYLKTIVLDEADRMLDEKNFEQAAALIKTTLKDRQLLYFSATITADTEAAIRRLSPDPLFLRLNRSLPDTIEHMYVTCEERDKVEVIRKIIHAENIHKALVFLNNQNAIETTVKRLNYHHVPSAALFGAAYKKERREALEQFQTGKVTLLVASDIAARGLDIKDVTHVINMDVPENPAFYLHRAGRTGRMGQKGICITVATAGEEKFIKKYEKTLNIKIKKKELSHGELKEGRAARSKPLLS